jgi:hypothetical protein
VLGKMAAAQIPHAKRAAFLDLGHAPEIQETERFHQALSEGLQATTTAAVVELGDHSGNAIFIRLRCRCQSAPAGRFSTEIQTS